MKTIQRKNMTEKLKNAVAALDAAIGSRFSRLPEPRPQDVRDMATLCGPDSFDLPELAAVFNAALRQEGGQ